jgi:apolipoprotein N-acyltransferase
MFVDIIPGKLSWDFSRPLGSPRGLIGLLHMLNVSHTKKDLCFILWFYVLFCFTKGIWWMPNIAYLNLLIYIS